MRGRPRVRVMAAALPAPMPAAALADSERFLDRLAVQMGRVDAAVHVEDFWKSVKPNKLGRQWRCLLLLHVREPTGII